MIDFEFKILSFLDQTQQLDYSVTNRDVWDYFIHDIREEVTLKDIEDMRLSMCRQKLITGNPKLWRMTPKGSQEFHMRDDDE